MKTNSQNPGFIKLTQMLDDELKERYGELQKQYDKYNRNYYIKDVFVVYKAKEPIACGAFKRYDSETVELKRIFVTKENRGQHISELILMELEGLAKYDGYKYAVLETGRKQPEAIGLYKNHGYSEIENYGPYDGNDNSICMKKSL